MYDGNQVIHATDYMRVEKDIFIELGSKYAPMIENKKSDAVPFNLKQKRGKNLAESITASMVSVQETLNWEQLKKL